MKYKDSKLPIPERVEDLLSRMTLEEKLEQMHCFGCVYTPEQELDFIAKGENKVHSEFYSYLAVSVEQLNKIQKLYPQEISLILLFD